MLIVPVDKIKKNHAVIISIFKLKQGVSVDDFMVASDKLNKEFLKKQKGYISRQLLSDGETWTDLLAIKSKELAEKIVGTAEAGGTAFDGYISLIDCDKDYVLTVQKCY